MDKIRIIIFTSVLMGLICVPAAWAQTAANITVLSGNGQVICECASSTVPFFLPMVVKVTDAGGNPIANKTVAWSISSLFQGQPAGLNFGAATQTDANGITSNTVNQSSLGGSFLIGFLQTTVVASADNVSATFTQTQALSDALLNISQLVEVVVNSPAQGDTVKGTAGAIGTVPILVHVDATGVPVPGASVRILNVNNPATGASAACQTGPGADPGSVLTDASGNASCLPVFGSIAGQGNFSILVGGVDATPTSGTPVPVAYFQSFNIPLVTTPAIPGSISKTAGDSQIANPGQTLAGPLTVRVADATGATPISGVSVTWSVSPAGAATINPVIVPTNSQGLASTTVTLSNLASGQVSVRAAFTGPNGTIFTSFNINVVIIVTLGGVTKVSGDSQTAIAGTAFLQPLVVQVSTTAGAPANLPVTFSVSGPANIGGITTSTVNTDITGRAQVAVTAGSTAGAVTVTATAGGFSQAFSLTVVPPGPSLTASSFFNAAGLKPGSMSPCSLATISATGLAPGVQGTLNPPSLFGQLPLALGPDRVTFNNIGAPIIRVSNSGSQEQITVQVPCEVNPGSSVPVTVTAAGGSSTVNVSIQAASPGIFETVMSDGISRAVMVRPDGSFVTLENPARRGEVIRVYVTGLGPTAPAVGTNSIPIPGTDSLVLGLVIVGVDNSGARVISARLAPTQIGIYEVAFQVDSNAQTGNNIVLSVALNPADGSPTQFSNGSKIPIQ